MNLKRSLWNVFATASLSAVFVATAQAQFVSSGFNMPVNATAALAFDCKNSPGPTISLGDGVIALGKVGGELTLSNNFKFTHSTSPGDIAVSAATFIDFGTAIQIPKQPSRPANYYGSNFSGTGVGGNPHIYVEFLDQNGKGVKNAAGNTLGPIYIGRCVQGAANLNAAFLEAAVASTYIEVDSTSCTNNPGPWITIDAGNLLLSGAKARVTFTNNAKWTHAASGDAFVDFDLIPAGGSPITWPKQPVLGGVGGNPHIWYIFKNGDSYVGTWPGFYLGRCVQGSK